MERKKIGYYISKGKCLKVFAVKKINKRTRRVQRKKVNSKGKAIRKGVKVYKTKAECEKTLRKMKKAPSRKVKKHKKVKRIRKQRFGQGCNYAVPYFGQFVPTPSKFASGSPDTGFSSINWAWPNTPSAYIIDKQQGGWLKQKN